MFHGIHHTFPQEKYRLVFPIAPGLVILYSFLHIPLFTLFESDKSYMLASGAYIGYVIYDLIHYSFHHSSPKTQWIKDLKAHHMSHHYRNGAVKYGVSNAFWDYVFRTEN